MFVIGLWWAAGCADLSNRFKVVDKGDKQEKAGDSSARNAPPPPAPRISPMTHVAAGQMLEKQGDLTGAIEQYEKAVTADPKLGVAYNRLGIAYQKMGRFGDAEQMFREGIRAEPESAMIQNNLGCNFLLQKKFFEAEEAFRFALVAAPDFKRAHMNLAIALVHQGRLEEALAEFGKAVPEDVAHYNVGVVCLQKLDYANGQAALRKALSINPKCRGAREQLDRAVRLAKSNPPPKPAVRPDSPPVTPLAGNASQEAGAVP